MSFKSNKSKLDFKVHYNFVYMSIFVCVYIYTPFFVGFFFLHNWICVFFQEGGLFQLQLQLFISTSIITYKHNAENSRETHRYHAPYDQDSQERRSSCLSIFRVGLPPSAPTPRFQVAVMISANHSEQWKMCMTSNYCSMSIKTEDEPEIKFVWSQSALIYRQYARH